MSRVDQMHRLVHIGGQPFAADQHGGKADPIGFLTMLGATARAEVESEAGGQRQRKRQSVGVRITLRPRPESASSATESLNPRREGPRMQTRSTDRACLAAAMTRLSIASTSLSRSATDNVPARRVLPWPWPLTGMMAQHANGSGNSRRGSKIGEAYPRPVGLIRFVHVNKDRGQRLCRSGIRQRADRKAAQTHTAAKVNHKVARFDIVAENQNVAIDWMVAIEMMGPTRYGRR